MNTDHYILQSKLQRLSQVFVNLKLDILRYALPRWTITADGQYIQVGYDPWTTIALADLDRLWDAECNEILDAAAREAYQPYSTGDNATKFAAALAANNIRAMRRQL